ncbi:carbohydrate porin [Nostocaceae cyanobacterium CENA357]|uniref:Carbohydrate porin n=1 Tax=Atlanticothrix silvestris CENA357 TaxID=1725252 RepID=A0A8J7HE63_9CYAN|nr:carbohydrate porin [Atlanticothrix silvestris CENA357]
MGSIFWRKFRLITLISSLTLNSITPAIATPIPTSKNNTLNKLPSVSRLSNIRVNSWEFQAVQALTEQYNCVSRDTEFGNQTVTRYQLAAKLNACLASINKLVINNKFDIINRETLTVIQKLQTEFSAELAILNQRLDLVETNVDALQAQQFSPHVELEGEIIFAVAGFAGGKKADNSNESINENLVLSDRVRLSLNSSFTGKDRLQVRLQARNIPELTDFTGTQMANLGFDGDTDNEMEVDELDYRFPLGEQTLMTFYALGGGLGDFVPSVNPLFSGSGDGSISTFGRENPIRRQGGGTGIGISHNLNDSLNLSLGYITSDAANPERGIFASPYGAIAQFTLEPTKTTAISFTYIHSYNNLKTGTGSELTSNPFDDEADAIAANSFGAEAAWQLNSTITLGGRVGFIHANAEDLPTTPNAVISTWAVLLALRDLGEEDSFAGFIVGQPPKIIHNSFGDKFEDQDTSLHLEAFYHFQITDHLAITPGLFFITNPEHNGSNNTIYVGTVRTTFTF